MILTLTALLSGVAVGVLLGLTGAGGGIFAIPFLTLAMGFSFQEAKPIALFAIAIGAGFGAIQAARAGHLRWRAAIFIAAIGSLISPLGNKIAALIPSQVLVYSFSTLMLFMAIRLLKQVWQTTQRDHCEDLQEHPCKLNEATGRLSWTRRCAMKLAAVGASAGLFSGLFGVGGGFVLVPALSRSTNISMPATTATSLMVIALVSTISAVSMIYQGISISDIGFDFIFAAGGGTLLGRELSSFVPTRIIQWGLGILMILTAFLFVIFN